MVFVKMKSTKVALLSSSPVVLKPMKNFFRSLADRLITKWSNKLACLALAILVPSIRTTLSQVINEGSTDMFKAFVKTLRHLVIHQRQSQAIHHQQMVQPLHLQQQPVIHQLQLIRNQSQLRVLLLLLRCQRRHLVVKRQACFLFF